ncbi:hypothetical protein PVAP13_2KG096564 [Panicum virgatum]|uniref:Uncharacterized protein n=1 Tax=Panicum virgatum TaxID=38727 RepID=A0A8T0VZN5_PANVG|nr:hypothetical protein PVAP13_2KG096564 [Panicum virgatum]
MPPRDGRGDQAREGWRRRAGGRKEGGGGGAREKEERGGERREEDMLAGPVAARRPPPARSARTGGRLHRPAFALLGVRHGRRSRAAPSSRPGCAPEREAAAGSGTGGVEERGRRRRAGSIEERRPGLELGTAPNTRALAPPPSRQLLPAPRRPLAPPLLAAMGLPPRAADRPGRHRRGRPRPAAARPSRPRRDRPGGRDSRLWASEGGGRVAALASVVGASAASYFLATGPWRSGHRRGRALLLPLALGRRHNFFFLVGAAAGDCLMARRRR